MKKRNDEETAPPEAADTPKVIALLTDFAPGEVYVGVMRGVLARLAPEAVVVDLCHRIAPGDVTAGALALEAAVEHFPAPTVFCCVVDPGVGTARRAIAAWNGRHYFIAPDNGLISFALLYAPEDAPDPEEYREILVERLESARPPSATFHGRDVFAPAAARVYSGGRAAFERLGPRVKTIEFLESDSWEFEELARGGWTLKVYTLAADSFGNLITSLRIEDLDYLFGDSSRRWSAPAPDFSAVEIHAGKRRWRGIHQTFADVEPGELVAYWGSGRRLEIAVRGGSAAAELKARPGEPVTLKYAPVQARSAGLDARRKKTSNRG